MYSKQQAHGPSSPEWRGEGTCQCSQVRLSVSIVVLYVSVSNSTNVYVSMNQCLFEYIVEQVQETVESCRFLWCLCLQGRAWSGSRTFGDSAHTSPAKFSKQLITQLSWWSAVFKEGEGRTLKLNHKFLNLIHLDMCRYSVIRYTTIMNMHDIVIMATLKKTWTIYYKLHYN